MTWNVLTTEEVAAELRVSASRVRQLISEGRIQGTREGNTYLFERAEVDRYIASRGQGKQKRPRAAARRQPAAQPRQAQGAPSPEPAAPRGSDRLTLTETGRVGVSPTPEAEISQQYARGKYLAAAALQEENARLQAENERLRAALEKAIALTGALSDLGRV